MTISNEPAKSSTASWQDESLSVTLTVSQWNDLTAYINLSTNFRQNELRAWEQLSSKTNPDGTTRFPNAASNAQFFRNLNESVESIKRTIDDRIMHK